MEEPRIDWRSADVDHGTLTLALKPKPDKPWRRHLKRTLQLLASERTAQVTVKKGKLRVEDVRPGSEAELRHLLEAVVAQANSACAREREASKDGDGAGGKGAEDARLTAAFRAFSG
jgi:hypothetical protein